MSFPLELRQHFMMSADDYGIRETSEPILKLVHAKKLDRVAVMVRYLSREEVAAIKEMGIKLDIHLELINLMRRGDRPNDGTLFRVISFLVRFFFGGIPRDAVRKEWEEQIKSFIELFGRLPDGLNSHEHIHYFPPFFGTFIDLAKKYNISHVRFGKKGILSPLRPSFIGMILHPLWIVDRKRFEASGLKTTDYVVDLNWTKSFEHLIESLPEKGSVEFIVHPEKTDEASYVMKNFPSV